MAAEKVLQKVSKKVLQKPLGSAIECQQQKMTSAGQQPKGAPRLGSFRFSWVKGLTFSITLFCVKRFARFLLLVVIALTASLYPGSSYAGADAGAMKVLQVSSAEQDFPVRQVMVWTPPLNGLDPNLLPVIYFLHGWPGSPEGIAGALIPPILKSIQSGAKPFIAVFPDGNAKSHIDSEWADSSDKKAMIETWLTTEVIAAVEGDHKRDRLSRALSGFSMGGYGAAIIALHHPELYSQVLPIAAYYKVDDLTAAFATYQSILFQTPSNFLKVSSQERWALSEGSSDFTSLVRGQALSWSKLLKASKAENTIFFYAGGHSYIDVAKNMSKLIAWLKWPASAFTPLVAPTAVPSPLTP